MIVGLTGSYGAGKGAVVEYLKTKGYAHFSASSFIVEEIQRRGLSIDRDTMIAVGNELRKLHGPAYIVESLFERASVAGGNAVIESIRATDEAKKIKELGGVVIGVDADSKIRYARAVARGSEKDRVTYEKWHEQETIESNTSDPTKQNIFGALKESDHIIQNDGTLQELYKEIDRVLEK